MNFDLQDRWIYALALVLMRRGDYQAIESPFREEPPLFTDFFDRPLPEMWLLQNEGRDYHLVRLQVVDHGGPSTFNRDLRQVADRLPLFRKRLHARNLQVTTLYLLTDRFPREMLKQLDHITFVEEPRHRLDVLYEPMAELTDINDRKWYSLLHKEYDRGVVFAEFETLLHNHSTEALKELIENEKKKQEKEFNAVFRFGKPIFTIVFLVINIGMFLFLESVGSSTDPQTLIEYGAKWNPLIVEGEYWRLVTPMFLHIGAWHILFNSIALYFLGGAVERIYGSGRFLIIYLLAGVLGTVASFAFTPNLAAGASGAIFGCFGALLYFGLKRRNLFFRTIGMDILFILGFNLTIGFILPMVDNYGHLGGLVGGFVAASLTNLPRERHRKMQFASAMAFGLLFLLLFTYGTQGSDQSPASHLIQAQIELNEGEAEQALYHIKQALEQGMDQPEIYVQKGVIYNYMEEYDKAEQTLNLALEKGGDQAELYFHLSYAQLQQENFEAGRRNLQEAIARDPNMKEAYYNLAIVYAEEGDDRLALEVLQRAYDRGLEDEQLEELYSKIKNKGDQTSDVTDDL